MLLSISSFDNRSVPDFVFETKAEPSSVKSCTPKFQRSVRPNHSTESSRIPPDHIRTFPVQLSPQSAASDCIRDVSPSYSSLTSPVTAQVGAGVNTHCDIPVPIDPAFYHVDPSRGASMHWMKGSSPDSNSSYHSSSIFPTGSMGGMAISGAEYHPASPPDDAFHTAPSSSKDESRHPPRNAVADGIDIGSDMVQRFASAPAPVVLTSTDSFVENSSTKKAQISPKVSRSDFSARNSDDLSTNASRTGSSIKSSDSSVKRSPADTPPKKSRKEAS